MKKYSNLFITIILLLLTIFMIISPSATVSAATNGFRLWYSILVPALLPFFVVAELIVALGLVKFIGIILEPIMRPMFRLPGSSSVVVVMGFTSGFPVGAILCKKLYEEKMLTANEMERLVSFTNNSSPLFIIGAIGVGMLSSPAYGYLLAICHYLANLIVGFLLRYKAIRPINLNAANPPTISSALAELLSAKTESIGKILGDAIRNSINNLLIIAGFIIFFSVLTKMFTLWGLIDLIALVIMNISAYFNITHPIAYGLGLGIFEITIGINTISLANNVVLIQLLAISILLSFSGLSIIAQVMGVVAGLPVRLSFYLKARLMQMSLATFLTYLAYKIFVYPVQTQPVMSLPYYKVLYGFDAFHFAIICLSIWFFVIMGLSLIAYLIRS